MSPVPRPPARPRRAALALVLALSGGGCADPGQSPYEIRPRASFRPIAADPPDGGTDFPIDQPITIHFDDPPDPRTVAGLRVDVTSGMTRWFGQLHVDLFEKTVTYRLYENLRPNTGYRLALDQALGGLGGGKLGQPWVLRFRSGSGVVGARPIPPAPAFAEILPLVLERCAGCHKRAPLDLSTEPALRASLVGVASSARPEVLRVECGDHARSFVVWQLLGLPIAGPARPHGGASREEASLFARWIDGGCR